MAWEQALQTVTMIAGQDLSSSQYCFVVEAADGQVDPSGDGAQADGVLQNDPSAAGQAASVAISGVTRVKAGAATTRGGPVASDSTGRAVNAATGDRVLGRFLEAAANADEIVTILLQSKPVTFA